LSAYLFFVSGISLLHAQHPTGIDFTGKLLHVGPRAPKVYYFPIDRHLLMHDYKSNAMMLNALDSLLRDPRVTSAIDTIEIFGACSPPASEEYNRKLALRRAQALKSYISRKHLDVAKAHPIVMRAIGIDHEGYRALKSSGQKLTEKLIWDLLQYTSVRLKMQDGSIIPPAGGSPIREIIQCTPEVIIRLVRDTVTIVDTVRQELPPIIRRDTVYLKEIQHDTVYIPHLTGPVPHRRHPLVFALKTNLLYDAALLPNLAVEAPFARRWSALIYGNWSWWDTKSPKYWSHRIQWAGAGLRHWWGNRAGIPLTGYFTGIYVSGGTYDLRLFTKSLDDPGYLSNRSWTAGITGGYAFPLRGRWSMELNISAGYMGGFYYKYNRSRCADCYPERATGNRRYIGPTGAAVNLVYRIGGTGNNNKKGKGVNE
jgi:hypothetical protein